MIKALNKDKIKLILMFIGLVIPFVINMNMAVTHDGLFHLRRIEDIYLSVKNDYFLSFVSQDLLNGIGYPTLGFYPYLLLFPFAMLRFLNFSSFTCYCLCFVFMQMLTVLTSYLFAKEVFDNKIHQYIFIYSVLFNPMRLFDVYTASALGRYSAFALLPLVCLGLYKIFNNKKHGMFILSLAMTLTAYTHIFSCMFFTIFIAICCFFNIKNIIKNVRIIYKIAIAGIISFLSSSFVIFPILEQLHLNLYFTDPEKIVDPFLLEFEYFDPLIFLTLIIFSILYYYGKRTTKSRLELAILWILILQTNLFPWQYIPILTLIQFTFRLLVFMIMFLGPYIIVRSKDINKTKKRVEICCGILVVLGILNAFSTNHKIITKEIEFPYCESYYSQNIGLCDYLPLSMVNGKDELTDTDFYTYLTQENLLELNKESNISKIDSNTFEIKENNSDKLLLPKIYFEGYQVKINDKIKEIDIGNYGLIEVDADNIDKGIITIEYVGTLIQKVTKIISGIFLSFYIIYPVYTKKRSSKN